MSIDRSEWTLSDPRMARLFAPPPRAYAWYEQLRTEMLSVTGIVWLSVIYLLYQGYTERDWLSGAIGIAVGMFLCIQPFRIHRVIRHGELVPVSVQPDDLGSIYFWIAHLAIAGKRVTVPLPPTVREIVRREGGADILVLTNLDRPALTFFVAHRKRIRG